MRHANYANYARGKTVGIFIEEEINGAINNALRAL